jgi:cell wall-associated NlpC family hydrolase
MRFANRLVVTVVASFLLAGQAGAASAARSWAAPQIERAIAGGVFDGPAASFRPDDPLTAQALADALARLTGEPGASPPDRAAPVTIAELDAALVRGLGLGGAAHRFYLGAQQAGLHPPPRFGTEVVARLLGLRGDRPPRLDALELRPAQVATRADAAYSVAQLLSFAGRPTGRATTDAARSEALSGTRPVQAADAVSRAFSVPALSDWQRRILEVAISYVGFPYVWGGTGEGSVGFDCSGFVLRVYKLTAYAGEATLSDVFRGRTTMAMSGEVPRRERIGLADLEPGDVLFFGAGPRSKPAQVDHAGIYVGDGWFVHSSGQGVALAQLEGWYATSFAWGRRPLAEAGLVQSLPAS